MINLKRKHLKFSKDEGFITLEIIVAILVAMGFLAVAMQSLVYAMAIKIQAQEKQRANQLINEDLEMANELANRSSLNIPVSCDAADYDDGYAYGLWRTLQDPDNDGTDDLPLPKSLLSDGGGRELALQRIQISSNANSDAPHRTLRIKYKVWDWDGTKYVDKVGNAIDAADKPIVETYVEIIPDVALACP